MIAIKRVYEEKSDEDGYRVLVDRLWPRGLSKEKAGVDLWMKDIGPSNELRKWFNHDPAKWKAFKAKYTQEMQTKAELMAELKELEAKHKKLTLLYGAHDKKHNQAVALLEELK